ncbi:MAG: cyclic lactone autoinducer peptide [Lachnospiraceae bacterium]|nr:cyclic lactone autoinducer peptide [Lachnospiraceae bacterium]
MLKDKMCNLLKDVAEKMAKSNVNEASAWMVYQDEEPAEARERFLAEE